MKNMLRQAFVLAVAAGALSAFTAHGAANSFPNADSAFGLKTAVSDGNESAARADPYCGTYYDPFKLIGGTGAESGYYDPHKVIGRSAEQEGRMGRNEIAAPTRIACGGPVRPEEKTL